MHNLSRETSYGRFAGQDLAHTKFVWEEVLEFWFLERTFFVVYGLKWDQVQKKELKFLHLCHGTIFLSDSIKQALIFGFLVTSVFQIWDSDQTFFLGFRDPNRFHVLINFLCSFH